ncbi:MAG: glutathione S-transferase family protein [Pseudomonadota bacterium]
MKLYYSQNSPFARIARIVTREIGLIDDVEELKAINRHPENPVLAYSSVGRVPTLVDCDLVITEAKSVVEYLSSRPETTMDGSIGPLSWQEIMQEGQIIGFVDGIGCWVRENRRDPDTVSSFLVNVEFERSKRCLEYLEAEAAHNRLGDFPHFRFVALAVGLDLMDFHAFHPSWRTQYPRLSSWFDEKKSRTSMQETAPVADV